MPRRTAKQETERMFNQFLQEAKDGLNRDISSTRQFKRRKGLLREIDALDRVEARFYSWVNGVTDNA